MKKGILITFLVIVVFILLIGLAVGFLYMQLTREPEIPGNALLTISISGPVVDVDDSMLPKHISIQDLWYHIGRAKIDNRIKGIVLKISYIETGLAKIEDIGRMILDFRKSNKKVYAFIEAGGIGDYYLATFADKTYLFKGGGLMLGGLAIEVIFLKKTLSKIGIQADFINIGEYKTAADMFTQETMSPFFKESYSKLLEDIYDSTIKGIARNRGLSAVSVRNIIDDSPGSNDDLLKAKMIDGLLYEDEIFKNSKENYRFVPFEVYASTSSPLPYEGSQRIAIIFASGEIHSGKSGGTSLFGTAIMGADSVAQQLRAARKSPSVKAVVLRVDSPGGSAVASEVIRREAELVAKVKPLVISMSDLAASGGYWISTPSNSIMALPQTITGSIGVISGKFVMKELYNSIGVEKQILKTSTYADMFTDTRPFNDLERKKITAIMENLYRFFLKITSKGRHIKIDDVDKIARGRVWAGTSAVNLKLVDKIGGINDAIDEAKKLAKIPAKDPIGVVVFPKKKSLFDTVYELLSGKALANTQNPVMSVESQVEMYKKFFPAFLMPYRLSFN